MQGGGVSRGVRDIFVGSAMVFILLGRTSEIDSPKTNCSPMHFLFQNTWGGGSRSAGGGGGSRGVEDTFMGSASVFILLGRTSEINSPKTNYSPMHFLF